MSKAPGELVPLKVENRVSKGPLFVGLGMILIVLVTLIINIFNKSNTSKNAKPATSSLKIVEEKLPTSSVVPQNLIERTKTEKKDGGFDKPVSNIPQYKREYGNYKIGDSNGYANSNYNSKNPVDIELQKAKLEVYKRALNAPIRIANDGNYNSIAANFVPPTQQMNNPVSDGPRKASILENIFKKDDPNHSERKQNFSESLKESGYLSHQKNKPISPYEIKQGWLINATLISGINTDLPGSIKAQVSQNIYDSVSGDHLLIPQGTIINGDYDHFVALGQERALVAWRRMIFPDGSTLNIENMAGQDQSGYAGFEDQVDNHYFKVFGNALLMSAIGAGFQLSQPKTAANILDPKTIMAAQVGQNLSQVSLEMIRKNLKIQPTIKIRPGYRFVIIANKDMILEPYN